MEDLKELNVHECDLVSGGLVFLIPPAVGFAFKVTGVSLGIVTAGTVTAFGLSSAIRTIFPKEEN
ncbi:hypothetical protein [Glaciecola sp. KUL10]|uniref:hypothetical protein n=1 Tax=Glaciecola sp. (strain KUL10) TaxID=2161813 RepID=UPI000D7876C9|nr:hypothetical protein [Glaciecola sp. KUL10]GBL05763.1 extra-cytoplasmic solute receptor [Glaciecola sp. KUL10]